eukprot:CAMPEP_0185155512 /NCGR_PEP_ID=MMETSP1139-20130426/491_1 /TAXON_ID=298111 /ORGANISM="Pavlova sp., Strain CCMP459" /LENGTH=165 /DNA_ID=CAMNT_0027720421 /DNA_START=464 /DNA_END=961 /DNA_ORIENTATION=+
MPTSRCSYLQARVETWLKRPRSLLQRVRCQRSSPPVESTFWRLVVHDEAGARARSFAFARCLRPRAHTCESPVLADDQDFASSSPGVRPYDTAAMHARGSRGSAPSATALQPTQKAASSASPRTGLPSSSADRLVASTWLCTSSAATIFGAVIAHARAYSSGTTR